MTNPFSLSPWQQAGIEPVISADAIAAAGGLTKVSVPAGPTAPGTPNTYAEDDDYFYLCVATDTWRRTPLAEWS